MRDLTDKQIRVLAFIWESIERKGWPPTVREIGNNFDIVSLRGVTVHLDALQRKGMIQRGSQARQITVTAAGKELLGTAQAVPPAPEPVAIGPALRVIENAPDAPQDHSVTMDARAGAVCMAAEIIQLLRDKAGRQMAGGIVQRTLYALVDEIIIRYKIDPALLEANNALL